MKRTICILAVLLFFILPFRAYAECYGKVDTKKDRLNIRREPNTEEEEIGKALCDELLIILDDSVPKWYHIQTADRKITGYVYKEYVELLDTSASGQAVVSAESGAAIRSGADDTHRAIATLQAGTQLELLTPETDGYFLAKLPDGSIVGYVQAVNLSFDGHAGPSIIDPADDITFEDFLPPGIVAVGALAFFIAICSAVKKHASARHSSRR